MGKKRLGIELPKGKKQTRNEIAQKENPRLSRKLSEFLRTCLRQVGAILNTPGLLTTRKCKLARHTQILWPLFKLVGSKNSVLHALCRVFSYSIVIVILAY